MADVDYLTKGHKTTPRCLPQGTHGPCINPLNLDDDGHAHHQMIKNRITGNLARGSMQQINGIIIHQTTGETAQSTFNHYKGAKSNGAHFLIAKDGTIYQTASVYKMTWHVGKLRSRCVAKGSCEPTNPSIRDKLQELNHIRHLSPRDRHAYEKKKKYPKRYPMNSDSIGIEIVGGTIGQDPEHPGNLLFEDVNEQQNTALTWLVKKLGEQFGVRFEDIFRHPVVSQKTPSEASTADWGKR